MPLLSKYLIQNCHHRKRRTYSSSWRLFLVNLILGDCVTRLLCSLRTLILFSPLANGKLNQRNNNNKPFFVNQLVLQEWIHSLAKENQISNSLITNAAKATQAYSNSFADSRFEKTFFIRSVIVSWSLTECFFLWRNSQSYRLFLPKKSKSNISPNLTEPYLRSDWVEMLRGALRDIVNPHRLLIETGLMTWRV
jgi:hypothetical protein